MEDQRQAREEAERAKFYVHRTVLEVPPTPLPPSIACPA